MKKTLRLLITFALLASLAACGETGNTSVSSASTPNSPASTLASVTAEPTVEPTQAAPDPTAVVSGGEYDEFGYIKKAAKACDEGGIYSLTLTFNNTIPAIGEVKFLFYNDESGVETVVCTYQAMYERSADGIYETKCLYNSDVDVNYHGKTELKIPVSFGATVRGKRAEVYLIENGNETKLADFVTD